MSWPINWRPRRRPVDLAKAARSSTPTGRMRVLAGTLCTVALAIGCSGQVIRTPDSSVSASIAPTARSPKPSSALPSVVAATPAPVGFGANNELFGDDFTDTAGGWQTFSGEGGLITYDPSGALVAQVTSDASVSSFSAAIDTVSWDVVRVEAVMNVRVSGAATYLGLLCGASSEDFAGAALGSNGLWAFIRKSGTELRALGHGNGTYSLDLTRPIHLRLDCAGTDTGSMRMQMWVEGALVASNLGDDGPAAFTNVGVYVEGAGNTVLIDDVVAYGGVAADLPPARPAPWAGG